MPAQARAGTFTSGSRVSPTSSVRTATPRSFCNTINPTGIRDDQAWQEEIAQSADLRRGIAAEIMGEADDHSDLRELRRLEPAGEEPGPGTAGLLGDREGEEQQADGGPVDAVGVPVEMAIVDRDHDADHDGREARTPTAGARRCPPRPRPPKPPPTPGSRFPSPQAARRSWPAPSRNAPPSGAPHAKHSSHRLPGPLAELRIEL